MVEFLRNQLWAIVCIIISETGHYSQLRQDVQMVNHFFLNWVYWQHILSWGSRHQTRRYGLGYIHVTMSQCQHSSQLTSMIWGSTCMISYCMQRTNKILLQRTNKILLQRTNKILLQRTNMILLQRILLQRTNKILLQRPCCRIHKKL